MVNIGRYLSDPIIIGIFCYAVMISIFYVVEMWPIWKENFSWKRKKGNALVCVYIAKDGVAHFDAKEVGTENSEKEISSGKRSYLHDPECVYMFPKEVRHLSMKPFSIYVHNDSLPLNLRRGVQALEGRKSPEELQAVLRTKVLRELMAGAANTGMGMLLYILIGAAVILFIASKLGWFAG